MPPLTSSAARTSFTAPHVQVQEYRTPPFSFLVSFGKGSPTVHLPNTLPVKTSDKGRFLTYFIPFLLNPIFKNFLVATEALGKYLHFCSTLRSSACSAYVACAVHGLPNLL